MKHVLLVVLALSTVACKGVGNGNKLERLRFVASTSDATDITTKKVFECFTNSVTVVGEFTDGGLGNFTNRVRYTSSNEGIAKISNGDIESRNKPGEFFVPGILVPVSPGFATISAEFAGLTAEVRIEVRTPESISVTQTNLRMAPTSTQRLSAIAVLDGVATDVTQAGRWKFIAPDDAVATIFSETAFVRAIAADAAKTLTAKIDFDACETAKASGTVDVEADIQVRDYSIKLQHESGYTGSLIRGSTEQIKAFADFGDGPEQDLSGQAGLVFSSTPADLISYSTATLLHLAVTAGSTDVTASFGADANLRSSLPADALPMTLIDATLQSLTITPDNTSIAALGTQQFTATGSFRDTATNTISYTQPIRRDVLWTSSDTAVASINSLTGFARALVAEPTADATVTITAVPNALLTAITPPPEATSTLKICKSGSSC